MTFDQALGKYTAHMRDNGATGELPFICKDKSETNDSKDAWILFDINDTRVALVDNKGVYGA